MSVSKASSRAVEAPAGRLHEHRLEIAASPEDVWKAITEAEELVRWFPLEAEVEPGLGGSVTLAWGDLRGTTKILAWDPPRHLRTTWLAAHGEGEAGGVSLAVDWRLEGERGKTRLRLVHSGFGTGPEWDEEYEGTRRGWGFELGSLKHYLERHRGKERNLLWVRKVTELDAAAAWKRLTGPRGLAIFSGRGEPALGDSVGVRAGKERLAGQLTHYHPPRELALTVPSLNDALVRVAYETCFGEPEAQAWVSLWGVGRKRVDELQARFEEALAEAMA